MKILFVLSSLLVLFQACGQVTDSTKEKAKTSHTLNTQSNQAIDPFGMSIQKRFNEPFGYERIPVDSSSFSSYLRNLPLKPHGSLVSFYNGEKKLNSNVYEAVVDLPIGKKDLHQCADAIIRLRADYLFENEKYDSIHFNFTNEFKANYSSWRSGKRIIVNGNKVYWKQTAQASDSPKHYWQYLEMVFSYAGTASLEKEMKSVSIEQMRIGDVFIKGGFPGHAVIVVDMAINTSTYEKIFLLAQSYMPAQELQILKNPNNKDLNPWYGVSEILNELRTPEWTFKHTELRRFSD